MCGTGGQVMFHPYNKGWHTFFYIHADWGGGGTTSSEVVSTWEIEFLAILKGEGRKKFPLFKSGWVGEWGGGGGRAQTVLLTVLRGGVLKVSYLY